MPTKPTTGNGRRQTPPAKPAAEETPPEEAIDLKDYPGFETIFTETRDQLIRQLGRMDSLDGKTGIIAGFDGLIVTAAVGSLPDLLAPIPSPAVWQAWVYRIPVILLSLGVIAIVASFLYAIKAYRIRTYSEIINPRSAYGKWLNKSEGETRMQLLHNMIKASEENETALNDKAESVKTSTWALLGGVLIFALAAVLFVVFNL